MAVQRHPDGEEPRRNFGRLKLGIPAVLETLHGRKHVRMVDLSQGGALVILPQDIPVRDCVVRWLGFELFASAAWQRATMLGLEFERALNIGEIMATRAQAPDLLRQEEGETRAAAKGWADGWYASGAGD